MCQWIVGAGQASRADTRCGLLVTSVTKALDNLVQTGMARVTLLQVGALKLREARWRNLLTGRPGTLQRYVGRWLDGGLGRVVLRVGQ